MKKTIITLVITTLMVGTTFTSNESSAQKEETAQANVQDAKEELMAVQEAANAKVQKAAKVEEWKIFWKASQVKIRIKEICVAELRVKMKYPGKTFDELYLPRIDVLELKNRDLQTRLETYEQSQSDWESFRWDFNHEMDELEQAFNDLTVDYKY